MAGKYFNFQSGRPIRSAERPTRRRERGSNITAMPMFSAFQARPFRNAAP
jgi:hypothetical protein